MGGVRGEGDGEGREWGKKGRKEGGGGIGRKWGGVTTNRLVVVTCLCVISQQGKPVRDGAHAEDGYGSDDYMRSPRRPSGQHATPRHAGEGDYKRTADSDISF